MFEHDNFYLLAQLFDFNFPELGLRQQLALLLADNGRNSFSVGLVLLFFLFRFALGLDDRLFGQGLGALDEGGLLAHQFVEPPEPAQKLPVGQDLIPLHIYSKIESLIRAEQAQIPAGPRAVAALNPLELEPRLEAEPAATLFIKRDIDVVFGHEPVAVPHLLDLKHAHFLECLDDCVADDPVAGGVHVPAQFAVHPELVVPVLP
jgi:hypothetical protein